MLSGTSPSDAPPCGALSSISRRSSERRSWVAPAVVSGVFRSESTPVSSTSGASVPLTVRSSDCLRKASCCEPNSTAMVLLPASESEVPEGAFVGERAVVGRGGAMPDKALESARLSGEARAGRYA